MAKRGRPRKTIAQLVWLGEGDVLETEWNEIVFRAGVPTDVSDQYMVDKARGNPFFEVIDG